MGKRIFLVVVPSLIRPFHVILTRESRELAKADLAHRKQRAIERGRPNSLYDDVQIIQVEIVDE